MYHNYFFIETIEAMFIVEALSLLINDCDTTRPFTWFTIFHAINERDPWAAC